jgi:hypothetical protein
VEFFNLRKGKLNKEDLYIILDKVQQEINSKTAEEIHLRTITIDIARNMIPSMIPILVFNF